MGKEIQAEAEGRARGSSGGRLSAVGVRASGRRAPGPHQRHAVGDMNVRAPDQYGNRKTWDGASRDNQRVIFGVQIF